MNYPKNRYTGVKPWMNKDWLYEEYVIKDRSTKEIANEYGCKQNTIQQWLLKHGIKKPITKHNITPKHQYQTYEYLYENHIVLGKSVPELARENNVSDDTIRHNLKKHNIKIQKVNQHLFRTEEEIADIIDLYCNEQLSALQIAKLYNTSHSVIIRTLKERGIDTRSMVEAQLTLSIGDIPPDFYNAELLQKWHWDENKTCAEIGKLLGGIDAGSVRRQMHRLDLSTKTNSESKIGLMTGKDHWNWKGGVTPLYLLLREYFNTNIAPKIAKRDNYTCQLCGATHTVLHVHHINEFSKINAEIISEHPDLDPSDKDDMYKLYNIIINDQRFTDENNLITFCKDCHFFKIHDYKPRKTISSQDSSIEE